MLHAYAFEKGRDETSFHRLLTTSRKPNFSNNTNVNVTRYGEQFVALTEILLAIVFVPHTLETIGIYDYETDAQIGTAHPHFKVIYKNRSY
jgi:beta,beta-carotene 9',10'-dioxygenase